MKQPEQKSIEQFRSAQLQCEGYPDNNPKTAFGMTKAPLDLVPPSASFYLAKAFADGAKKYHPYNWREKGISSSVYYAAAKRHLDAWWDGEDIASDSGVEHIAHAMACCALILDSASVGMLNDNRPPKGALAQLLSNYIKEGENKDKHAT